MALADGRVFTPIDGNPHYVEYNIVKDILSAGCWPSVGRRRWSTAASRSASRCPIPRRASSAITATSPHHPLAEAYISRNPPPHNRPTWDLTSVLLAVLPIGTISTSRRRAGHRRAGGFTRFRSRPQRKAPLSGPQARAEAGVLEALVQLSSQPPSHCEAARP